MTMIQPIATLVYKLHIPLACKPNIESRQGDHSHRAHFVHEKTGNGSCRMISATWWSIITGARWILLKALAELYKQLTLHEIAVDFNLPRICLYYIFSDIIHFPHPQDLLLGQKMIAGFSIISKKLFSRSLRPDISRTRTTSKYKKGFDRMSHNPIRNANLPRYLP